MATVAITLGIIGLFTWMVPFLGLLICIISVVLGTIALKNKTPFKKRAIVGLVTGSIGLIFSVLFLVIGITVLGMLGIFGGFLEEWINLYGLP